MMNWKIRIALGLLLCVVIYWRKQTDVETAAPVPSEQTPTAQSEDALPTVELIPSKDPQLAATRSANTPARANPNLIPTPIPIPTKTPTSGAESESLVATATVTNPIPQSRTQADYDRHIAELKKRLPAGEFHIVLQEPFVVIGNEAQQVVEQRSKQTVKWAVERIKKDYFAKDPDAIIDIWLFKDKPTYEHYATKWFGGKPTTPFGYYSPTYKSLVMNISTGGGTLVHEIVHPFMSANFPDCPAWFNEGLASLYEQSRDNEGKIWGSTNWRLRGLQEAITAKQVPSFETLCHTTTTEFYQQDRGTHYSQARYLCYYLQEHGLLRSYYHAFVKNAKQDPSGFETLKKTLQIDSKKDQGMEEFQKQWEAYVMHLRF